MTEREHCEKVEQDAVSAYEKALSDIEQDELESAKASLLESLRIAPGFAPACNKLGVIAALKKQSKEATENFQRAIELDEKYGPAFSNLGNLQQEAGNLDKAAQLYEKACSRDRTYWQARNNLASVRRAQGRSRESVALLREARRIRFARASQRIRPHMSKRKNRRSISKNTTNFKYGWIKVPTVLLMCALAMLAWHFIQTT